MLTIALLKVRSAWGNLPQLSSARASVRRPTAHCSHSCCQVAPVKTLQATYSVFRPPVKMLILRALQPSRRLQSPQALPVSVRAARETRPDRHSEHKLPGTGQQLLQGYLLRPELPPSLPTTMPCDGLGSMLAQLRPSSSVSASILWYIPATSLLCRRCSSQSASRSTACKMQG